MHRAECTYCHWGMGIHRRTGSKSLRDEWLGPFSYATAETVLHNSAARTRVSARTGTPQATEEFRTLATSLPAPTTALADTAQSTKTGTQGAAADLIADDEAPLPFPTPGAELLYEDPGWDLVEYAGLLCLAEKLALSGKDEAIARTIALLEDTHGGGPPDNLQGFHDGLLAELRGLGPLASATPQGV